MREEGKRLKRTWGVEAIRAWRLCAVECANDGEKMGRRSVQFGRRKIDKLILQRQLNYRTY